MLSLSLSLPRKTCLSLLPWPSHSFSLVFLLFITHRCHSHATGFRGLVTVLEQNFGKCVLKLAAGTVRRRVARTRRHACCYNIYSRVVRWKELTRYAVGPTLTPGASDSFVLVGANKIVSEILCLCNGEGFWKRRGLESAVALVLIVIIIFYRHDWVTEMDGPNVRAPRPPILLSNDNSGFSSLVKLLKPVVIQSRTCSGNVKSVWRCASTSSFLVMPGRWTLKRFSFSAWKYWYNCRGDGLKCWPCVSFEIYFLVSSFSKIKTD